MGLFQSQLSTEVVRPQIILATDSDDAEAVCCNFMAKRIIRRLSTFDVGI